MVDQEREERLLRLGLKSPVGGEDDGGAVLPRSDSTASTRSTASACSEEPRRRSRTSSAKRLRRPRPLSTSSTSDSGFGGSDRGSLCDPSFDIQELGEIGENSENDEQEEESEEEAKDTCDENSASTPKPSINLDETRDSALLQSVNDCDVKDLVAAAQASGTEAVDSKNVPDSRLQNGEQVTRRKTTPLSPSASGDSSRKRWSGISTGSNGSSSSDALSLSSASSNLQAFYEGCFMLSVNESREHHADNDSPYQNQNEVILNASGTLSAYTPPIASSTPSKSIQNGAKSGLL